MRHSETPPPTRPGQGQGREGPTGAADHVPPEAGGVGWGGGDDGVGPFPDPADGVHMAYGGGGGAGGVAGGAGPMEAFLARGGKLPVLLLTCNREQLLGETIKVGVDEELAGWLCIGLFVVGKGQGLGLVATGVACMSTASRFIYLSASKHCRRCSPKHEATLVHYVWVVAKVRRGKE